MSYFLFKKCKIDTVYLIYFEIFSVTLLSLSRCQAKQMFYLWINKINFNKNASAFAWNKLKQTLTQSIHVNSRTLLHFTAKTIEKNPKCFGSSFIVYNTNRQYQHSVIVVMLYPSARNFTFECLRLVRPFLKKLNFTFVNRERLIASVREAYD